MRGWGFRGMAKYPYLIPLYVCASVGAGSYLILGFRALFGPDVCLKTRPNLEISNEAYRNRQYKLWGSGADKIICHAPIYWPQKGENIENPYDEQKK